MGFDRQGVHRIFLSYTLSDASHASSLYEHLTRRGLAAWLDAESMRFRANARREVTRALLKASLFVLVVSRRTLARPFPREEYAFARLLGLPIIVWRIEPVLLPPELLAKPVVAAERFEDAGLAEVERLVRRELRRWQRYSVSR